jgi:hypothetical protein
MSQSTLDRQRELTVYWLSSPELDDPPKSGFFRLPFFGGAFIGIFSLAFIGVPRPPDGR